MDYFFSFAKLPYVQGRKPEGCILCMVTAGACEVADLRVYEDPLFFVCVNLYPYNPGHLMICPTRHVEDVRELSPDETAQMFSLQKKTLDVLDAHYRPAGYNIGFNMGPVAGASIRHLHLHLIPRYPGELGIADLLAGKRVLVEDPQETTRLLKAAFAAYEPSSIRRS